MYHDTQSHVTPHLRNCMKDTNPKLLLKKNKRWNLELQKRFFFHFNPKMLVMNEKTFFILIFLNLQYPVDIFQFYLIHQVFISDLKSLVTYFPEMFASLFWHIE